jgi:hypothetical protein
MITFNRGVKWHFLKAPNHDHKGNEIFCTGECSLHLQIKSGYSIFSSTYSPGIILGVGNVGM